jgi:hypothetical protein
MEAQELSPAQKLDHARRSVRFVRRSITAVEGRTLSFDEAEELHAELLTLSRNLEELTLALACLERKVNL